MDYETYENGFGSLSDEFWLDLEKLHRLAANGEWTLKGTNCLKKDM